MQRRNVQANARQIITQYLLKDTPANASSLYNASLTADLQDGCKVSQTGREQTMGSCYSHGARVLDLISEVELWFQNHCFSQ